MTVMDGTEAMDDSPMSVNGMMFFYESSVSSQRLTLDIKIVSGLVESSFLLSAPF